MLYVFLPLLEVLEYQDPWESLYFWYTTGSLLLIVKVLIVFPAMFPRALCHNFKLVLLPACKRRFCRTALRAKTMTHGFILFYKPVIIYHVQNNPQYRKFFEINLTFLNECMDLIEILHVRGYDEFNFWKTDPIIFGFL